MGEGRIRAFIAFAPPDDVRRELAALARDLAAPQPGLRPVRPEGIHLTLRFLGSSREDQLERVAGLVRRAAVSCPRLQGEVGGLGLFPPRGAPRVLWVGLTLEPSGFALQRACEEAAVAAGFAKEERPFRPHLTLGRWKERVRRPSLPELAPRPLLMDELILFRSEPRPEGSVYTPLQRFPLGSLY